MDPGNNGKGNKNPDLQPPPQINPEDIAAEVRLVLTKQGGMALFGPIENIPLMLQMLSDGVAITGQLAAKVLPQRIIPVNAPLPPPGTIPFGRAGR